MKKLIFKFLIKFFSREVEEYHIQRELPMYQIKATDKNAMKLLSDLYEDEGYKILIKLWCNYKNRLGRKVLNREAKNNYEDAYWRGFYRGQSYFISHCLTLIRSIHNKWKKGKED